MAKALIAIFFVLCAANGLGMTTCGVNRQIYDLKSNISLNLGARDEDKVEVIFYGKVTLERLDKYTQLQVMELSMTDYKKNVYPNPIGIEKPITISVQDSGDYKLKSKPGDSVPSIAIKRHIISLLPRQAITKNDDNPNLGKIKTTQDLLEQADKKIVLKESYKDLIVVLGNTGAGKSTLTQWLAGDNCQLEAKEVHEGEYVIEDNLNRIGDSTLDSKTIFPELVINKEHNEAFYDFPGFSDTRDSSYDIATSYFIKTTLDHAKSIKMLFVVGYPSVRKGVDRQDFLKLMRHISELIKDMKKFHDSLALVVTKVDNQFVYNEGKFHLIDDTIVIAGIAKFLEEAKSNFQNRISKSDSSSKDLKFYKSSITFLNAILEQKDNKYTRIGIFRRPIMSGSLNKMKTFQKEKEKLSNIIYNTLKYTEKLPDDFGRTVSDRSKNDINDLIQEIDKNILFSTCSIADTLQRYFKDLRMQLSMKINIQSTSDITIADRQLKEIRNLFENFTYSLGNVEKLTNSIRNLKNDESLSELIYDRVTSIQLPSLDEHAKEILNQGKYLNFLQSISDTKSYSRLSPLAWASSFQNILTEQSITLSRTQNDINNIESKISKTFYYEVTKIGKDFVELFSKEEEKFNDLNEILNKLRLGYNKIAHVHDIDNKADYIDYIFKLCTDFKINTSKGVQMYLTKDARYFDQFKSIINEVFVYLHNSQFYYNYLIDLHKTISTYKFQKSINNVNNFLRDMSLLSAGKSLRHTLPEEIIKIMAENNSSNNSFFENIILNKFQVSHLKKMVSISLQKPEVTCETNGKLVVKGVNVKLSDVSKVKCNEKIKLIEVFALNKVFFDVKHFYLTGTDTNMAIIAPTWDVQDVCEILLDGLAYNDYKFKANSGHHGGTDGSDGQPGLPGGSAGHFYGVGKTFINTFGLSISANGGNGGSGQDGGDGAKGSDGNTPKIGKLGSHLDLWIPSKTNVYGDSCSNGGDGGKGGQGGTGGYPGKITIRALDKAPWIKTSSRKGQFGANGVSGEPGGPGKPGTVITISGAKYILWGDIASTKYSSLGRCESGSKPSNVNSVGFSRSDANDEIIVDDVNNDYKIFFKQKLEELPIVNPIKEFVTKI